MNAAERSDLNELTASLEKYAILDDVMPFERTLYSGMTFLEKEFPNCLNELEPGYRTLMNDRSDQMLGILSECKGILEEYESESNQPSLALLIKQDSYSRIMNTVTTADLDSEWFRKDYHAILDLFVIYFENTDGSSVSFKSRLRNIIDRFRKSADLLDDYLFDVDDPVGDYARIKDFMNYRAPKSKPVGNLPHIAASYRALKTFCFSKDVNKNKVSKPEMASVTIPKLFNIEPANKTITDNRVYPAITTPVGSLKGRCALILLLIGSRRSQMKSSTISFTVEEINAYLKDKTEKKKNPWSKHATAKMLRVIQNDSDNYGAFSI